MNLRALALLSCALVLVQPADFAAAGTGACGGHPAVPSSGHQKWPAKQQLYYFDTRNRLVRSDFDGSHRTVVSDRGFDQRGQVEAHMSPDARFVAYGTNLASRKLDQLWLLDLSNGQERLLLQGVPYSIGIPVFSADSRRLAVDIEARTDEQRKDVGLYAFELPSGARTFAGWPPESGFRIGFGNYMFPDWSADNQLLASMIGDGPKGPRTREYWRFDLPSKRFEQIDGRYNDKIYESEFKMAGRWLPLAKAVPIPGSRGSRELPAAGGRLIARVDAGHRLEIQDGSSHRIVAHGSYSDCEGESLRLNGWVDGDRYLVFANGFNVFIHDPRSGNTAPLPLKETETISFFWGPPQPGLAPN